MKNILQKNAMRICKTEAKALPADFEKWYVNNVARHVMYYQKNENGSYFGFCDCGADYIQLDHPRSGKEIVCPVCGRKVKLRNDRHKPYVDTRDVVCYVQKTSDGWMQRIFLAYNSITYRNYALKNRCVVDLKFCEEQRDVLLKDGTYFCFHPVNYYVPEQGWRSGRAHVHGMGWCAWTAESSLIFTYNRNLRKIFANSEFKYSQLDVACKKWQLNPFGYLAEYARHPQLEVLIKLKLYKLAYELYQFGDGYMAKSHGILDASAKSLKGMYGLTRKTDVKFCRKHKLNGAQLQAYLHMKKFWRGAITNDAIDFMAALYERCGYDFKYDFISLQAMYKYYKTQDYDRPGFFVSDYTDYIGECCTLNFNLKDTKVCKPHDLKYCHRVTSARAQEVIEERRSASFAEYAQTYSEIFEYSDEKFCLIVPKTEMALKAEGKAQHNCVGGYSDRIAKGLSIVLFLRRALEPKKSFCTVEVRPSDYSIVQNRSAYNMTAPGDAEEWLTKTIRQIAAKQQRSQATAQGGKNEIRTDRNSGRK